MNANQEKIWTYFLKKISTFEFQRKKKMASQLFEFLEQLMIDTILIKLTQFEKTGFIGNIFLFRREIRKLNSIYETRSQSRFS